MDWQQSPGHIGTWPGDHPNSGIMLLRRTINSFEMHKMTVRTDQLLCIAEATNYKVYIWKSEAEAHCQAKALVLSVKQCHAPYYWLYEKGMTRVRVGLQGLQLGNAFRCSNISSSVGLKSFCSWCFKLRGTPRQSSPTSGRCITSWLLSATCVSHSPTCLHKACWTTAQGVRPSMLRNTQNRKYMKGKNVTQEEVQVMRTGKKTSLSIDQVTPKSPECQSDAQHLPSNSTNEHGLVYTLDLPESFWSCLLSKFSLNCTNCHVFVSTKMFITPCYFG